MDSSDTTLVVNLKLNKPIAEENLACVIKQITAKHILALKSLIGPNSAIEALGNCILLLFGKNSLKNYPWEQVAQIFANPGLAIYHVRNTPVLIQNKKIPVEAFKEISLLLAQVRPSELFSHKLNKELEFFYTFCKESCDFFFTLWPENKANEPQKKKFKIPRIASANDEKSELQQKINKEKKMLQEIKYQERRLKWEEERSIKKEMKQEELRELQREINYSKSIDDEFKRNQAIKKNEERENARNNISRTRNFSCNKSKRIGHYLVVIFQ